MKKKTFFVISACFSALRSIIAVELMGIEKLTNAFGILMMFQGLAAVIGNKFFRELVLVYFLESIFIEIILFDPIKIGGPIAGALYDATKSYDYSFYFAGGLITLSAILCYPIKIVNRWEKKRALETSKVSPAV